MRRVEFGCTNIHFVNGHGPVEYCAHATDRSFHGHRTHPPPIINEKPVKVALPGFDESKALDFLSR